MRKLDEATGKKERQRPPARHAVQRRSPQAALKHGCTNVPTIISKAATNAYKSTMN
jgi:hypothetical protein